MKFQFKKRENPIMISSEFFFETKVVYNPDGIQVALAKSSDLIHWEEDRRLPIEPGMQCLTERIQENC